MQESTLKLVNNFFSAEKFLAKRAAHLMSIDIIRSLLSNFARTSSAQQQSKRLTKIETLNYKVWANICLKLLQSKEVENVSLYCWCIGFNSNFDYNKWHFLPLPPQEFREFN